MRLLELIETMQINESAKSRYMSMLNGMPEVSLGSQGYTIRELMRKQIPGAVKAFKKDDRIIWYLKWERAYLVNKAMQVALDGYKRFSSQAIQSQDSTAHERFLYYKNLRAELADYAKKLKPNPAIFNHDYGAADKMPNLSTSLRHYLSLPIPEIQNTVFRDQTPNDLIEAFEEYEEKWKAERKHALVQQEGTEELIRFPDGSGWFNLNKNVCDDEAKAMGHCGNAGNPQKYDIILSYRTPKQIGGQLQWEPHLTFILDTRNGLLGEMKGRGNDKPVAKYHPAIIALLENPIVKGIKGGGYLPQNNFSINDLPENIREKLITEKPALNLKADLESFYFPENFQDPKLVERVKKTLATLGLNIPDFTGETKMFDYGDGDELPEILLYKTNKPMSATLEELATAKARSEYSGSHDEDFEPGMYVRAIANCLRSLETGDYSWISETYRIPQEYVEANKPEFERMFRNIRRSFEATINNEPNISPHLISDGSGTKVYMNADEFARDIQIDDDESFDQWPGPDIRVYLYEQLYTEISDLYEHFNQFIHRTVNKIEREVR